MKTIYLDPKTFKCYVENDGTRIAVETAEFDGKCDAYIEATRFVPEDESWTREDGSVFHGEMVTPWKDSRIRDAYQEQYEAQNAQLQAAYQEGVNSAYD